MEKVRETYKKTDSEIELLAYDLAERLRAPNLKRVVDVEGIVEHDVKKLISAAKAIQGDADYSYRFHIPINSSPRFVGIAHIWRTS